MFCQLFCSEILFTATVLLESNVLVKYALRLPLGQIITTPNPAFSTDGTNLRPDQNTTPAGCDSDIFSTASWYAILTNSIWFFSASTVSISSPFEIKH